MQKTRQPRSLLRSVAVLLFILLGLYGGVVLVQYMMDDSDPDRPPIIISSGSINVDSGGDWIDKGNKGYKQDVKGKSVKTFAASTGIGPGGSACSVQGKSIVVTYGATEFTLSRKSLLPGLKSSAFVQFAAAASVAQPSPGHLQVTTTDTLVSFRNETGTSCAVQDGRISVQQQH